MAKGGIISRIISAERSMASKVMAFDGYYQGKHTNKDERIHVTIRNELTVNTIEQTSKRCTCGGWTFSKIRGMETHVCRHCGKQYFKTEFAKLPDKPLKASEIHDRHIYSVLLSGGDLREHAEESKLVFKDGNGIPLGHLPMEYASHLEQTYRDAKIMRTYKAPLPVKHALDVSTVGAL